MTNPTGPRTFFERFYTHEYNFKRKFYSDEIWSSTDSLYFWGSRPLCSSRLRPQEKSLVDQLPLDQNLLKTVLSWTTFLNWRPLASRGLKSQNDSLECPFLILITHLPPTTQFSGGEASKTPKCCLEWQNTHLLCKFGVILSTTVDFSILGHCNRQI